MAERRLRALIPACAVACVLAACAGWPRPGGPPRAGDAACEVVPGGAHGAPAPREAGAPVVVGVPGPVDPAHAPVPRSAAERLVFAQLYETLVRVACDGSIEPGLAAEWRSEADGREWTFVLRAGARDWTGAPVTSRDVAESWRAAERSWLEAGGTAVAARAQAAPLPLIAGVTLLDERTLRVDLHKAVPLRSFARPELAVRTSASYGGWPAGTGVLRPEHAAPPSGAPGAGPLDRLVLRTAQDAGGAALELRAVGADARNALDAGVDVLVTREPEAADYAAGSGAFRVLPLLWDRAYVLVAPGVGARDPAFRAAAKRGGEHLPRSVLPPAAALEALARDAVRADARPAAGLLELGRGTCRLWLDGTVGAAGSRRAAGAEGSAAADLERVVYPPGDPVARALAERLVALAPGAGRAGEAEWLAEAAPLLAAAGARARAEAAPTAEGFLDALWGGGAAAFVVPLSRAAGERGCEVLDALLVRAAWLAAGEPREADAGAVDTAALPRLVPLVETRPALIVRHGIGGVAVDGDGTLRLGRVRRVSGGRP